MQLPKASNLSGFFSSGLKARMAGGGLMGNRAGWYIAVAALPIILYAMGAAQMEAQKQQMIDQITNPQGFQQQQQMGPQMQLPQINIPGLPQNIGDIPYGLAPVDLPIENIGQETNVWCWAAVSQQIIAASRGREQTPQQCALVAVANGASEETCCVQRNPQCVITGSLPQIQGLIQRYGGRTSSYAEPTDPMTLYRTLKQGHAVIIGLQTDPSSGHVVVARGMSFQETPQGVTALVHINNPMAQFTQPVPFQQIAGLWRQAIIVN